MAEAKYTIARRTPLRQRPAKIRAAAALEAPRCRRKPPRRKHVAAVAIVYASMGFILGGLAGAFIGWFVLPACLGATAAAAAGVWLEISD